MNAARSKPRSDNTGDGAHLANQRSGSRTRIVKVYILTLVAALFAWPVSAQEAAAPQEETAAQTVPAQTVGEKLGEPNPRKEGAAAAGTIIGDSPEFQQLIRSAGARAVTEPAVSGGAATAR